jgi:hypothetical protein
MASTAAALSRTLVGKPLRSDRLDDTLLPKRLALPVFCSDPLSSVAYATEQILLVLGLGGLALSKGKPQASAGAVLGMLGALLIVAAMLANALYNIGDARLGGTVFEEGTRLYVGYGAVVAALGGVAHWAPKLWGRMLPTKVVIPLGMLGFVATVLASLPYLIAGFAKQPADAVVFDYSGPKELWNALSLIGHVLMFLTIIGFILVAVGSLTAKNGDDVPDAGDDPWNGQTLEWATSSPAPAHNFAEVPVVTSPEPLLDLKQQAGLEQHDGLEQKVGRSA